VILYMRIKTYRTSKYWLLTLLFFSIQTLTCSAQTKFDVGGKINGIASGTAFLSYYDFNNKKSIIVDSVKITNSSFKFTGQVDVPKIMDVRIEPGTWKFQIFVENASIKLAIDTAEAEHNDLTRYGYGKWADIKKFKEYGSKNDSLYEQFLNKPNYKESYQALMGIIKRINDQNNSGTEDSVLQHKYDSLQAGFVKIRREEVSKILANYPSSLAAVYLLYQFWDEDKLFLDFNYLESALKNVFGDARATSYFEILTNSANTMSATQPGKTAPDFILQQMDSSELKLSSFEGRYLLIDFWASWCVPCRQEIPHVKELYEKYKGNGLNVLSISSDWQRKDWIKALEQENMPWSQVIDKFPKDNGPGKVAALYSIYSIPVYILLDKRGIIVLRTQRVNELDAKMQLLIGR
jgi:thiol-disulfide isomerase/thioredoxin